MDLVWCYIDQECVIYVSTCIYTINFILIKCVRLHRNYLLSQLSIIAIFFLHLSWLQWMMPHLLLLLHPLSIPLLENPTYSYFSWPRPYWLFWWFKNPCHQPQLHTVMKKFPICPLLHGLAKISFKEHLQEKR